MNTILSPHLILLAGRLSFPGLIRKALGLVVGLFLCGSLVHGVPTYPPLTSFLYGKSGVNAVGQTTPIAGGTGLPYRYLVPAGYDPANKYPVILFLHGNGEAGTNNTKQLEAGNNTANGALALVSTANPNNQANFPCFFVAPQFSSGGWSARATDLKNILTTLKAYYSIDESRIILTGISQGALDGWTLAGTGQGLDGVVSCLVPLSGGATRQDLIKPTLPVWAFHAVDEWVSIQPQDNAIALIRNAGYPLSIPVTIREGTAPIRGIRPIRRLPCCLGCSRKSWGSRSRELPVSPLPGHARAQR